MVTKRSYLKKSKMVTKWVPNGSNGIRTPSFCISHRDLSHGGLPEAKNRFPKFGCAIFGEKKAPAGAATQEDRTCQKTNFWSRRRSPAWIDVVGTDVIFRFLESAPQPHYHGLGHLWNPGKISGVVSVGRRSPHSRNTSQGPHL